MTKLSEEGRRAVGEIAERHGVSTGAVEHLLMAVIAGQGSQAQFNHPDLGGMGQWSQGGMTMVGDMFNNALKAKVDGVCSEVALLVREANLLAPSGSHQSQSQSSSGDQRGGGVSLFVPGALSAGNWWPHELGRPASTGAQNQMRYAFFPETQRLAIEVGGWVTVYDTKDHRIGGFSQQQSGDQSLSFTSQHGLVKVADLDVVQPVDKESSVSAAAPRPPEEAPPEAGAAIAPEFPMPDVAHSRATGMTATAQTEDDIFSKIERIAALYAKGILTDKEFETKKAELLARI